MNFKKAIVIVVSILLSGCASQESLYKQAVKSNTINSYEQYLAKYPQGEFSKDVKAKIEKLEFDSAVEVNTIQSYEQYLAKYPQGEFSKDAKGKIEKLEFDEIKNINTIDIYVQYMKKYPQSSCYNDVINEMSKLMKKMNKSEQAELLVNSASTDTTELKLLIDSGVDVNAKSKKGKTALETAVDYINEKGVEFLLNHGAIATASDLYSAVWMEFVYLKTSAFNALSGFFAKHGVKNDPNEIYVRHLNILKMIINTGVNVNEANKDGRTALHIVVKYGNQKGGYEHAPKMAKLLLEAGANPDKRNNEGKSPRELTQNPTIIELFKGYIVKSK